MQMGREREREREGERERETEAEVGALGRTWRQSGESNDIGLLD